MDYIYHYSSPLGAITFASDGTALTGLWFDGQKYDHAGLSSDFIEQRLPVFDETMAWLDSYFGGSCPDHIPPLRFHSTPFREKVWRILLTIPYGSTMTYGEIARMLSTGSSESARSADAMPISSAASSHMSAQAVGGAVSRNPISIIVPCHRVIGAGGSLTGYAGGIERKLSLLRLEGYTV